MLLYHGFYCENISTASNIPICYKLDYIVLVYIVNITMMLGTGEDSQGANPQSCSVPPWEVDDRRSRLINDL
jgi:hypothetical protein